MKKFIVVVDIQNDFIEESGALYVKGSKDIIPNIRTYLNNLNTSEIEGVLFTMDTHGPYQYPNSKEAEQFPPHCYKDTHGWELILNPNDYIHRDIPIYTLEKNVFSMWEEDFLFVRQHKENKFGTVIGLRDRNSFFTHIINEGEGRIHHTLPNAGEKLPIKDIVILGVASDYCVKWAIDGLIQRGFNIEIIENCCKGIDQDIKEVIQSYPENRIK